MITQLSCSPGTSTPCQKEAVANKTALGVERNSSSKALRGPVPCKKRFVGDFHRNAIVDQAHLLVAGEKHESPATAEEQKLDNFARGGGCECGTARVGKILGNVQQSLFGVIEMAGDDQRSRGAQAEADFGELEFTGDGQRRGGENYGIDRVEKFLIEETGNVDGRGLKKGPAAALFDPINILAVAAFHPELQAPRDFPRAMRQRNGFLGRGFQQLELQRDQFQAGQDVAIGVLVLH